MSMARVHIMHIVTDGPIAWCVCLSFCHACAKTAERIEVMFGVENTWDPRHTAFYCEGEGE